MTASIAGCATLVPDPPGGLVGNDDAIRLSLSSRRHLPVDRLADPHHLADTDPDWAGGDVLRLRKLVAMVTPSHHACGARTARRGAGTGRRLVARRAWTP